MNSIQNIVRSYTLPSEEHLPRPRVNWSLDSTRAVILVHDMQNYFLDAFTSAQSLKSLLVENVRHLVDVGRGSGVPIIFSAQPGSMSAEQRGLLADLWGPGMTAADGDRAITKELSPQPGDIVLTKWRYSAFFNSGLIDELRRRGRDQLVVAGIYAHVGILATALDAYSYDIETFVPADGIASFTSKDHLQALEFAASTCAKVGTVGSFSTAFRR